MIPIPKKLNVFYEKRAYDSYPRIDIASMVQCMNKQDWFDYQTIKLRFELEMAN